MIDRLVVEAAGDFINFYEDTSTTAVPTVRQ